MLKKSVSMLLIFLVANLATFAFALGNEEKEAKFAEKVRSEVAKLGTGTDAKIQVKLKDGTKLKGYISEANEKEFVVVDSKGKATPVTYPQTKQVKGNNLLTGIKILIGMAIFIAIIGIIVANVKD